MKTTRHESLVPILWLEREVGNNPLVILRLDSVLSVNMPRMVRTGEFVNTAQRCVYHSISVL